MARSSPILRKTILSRTKIGNDALHACRSKSRCPTSNCLRSCSASGFRSIERVSAIHEALSNGVLPRTTRFRCPSPPPSIHPNWKRSPATEYFAPNWMPGFDTSDLVAVPTISFDDEPPKLNPFRPYVVSSPNDCAKRRNESVIRAA